MSGAVEKATTPTFALDGSWSMNVLAACIAACRRVGATSVEAIEPEWSSTSISEAARSGTR